MALLMQCLQEVRAQQGDDFNAALSERCGLSPWLRTEKTTSFVSARRVFQTSTSNPKMDASCSAHFLNPRFTAQP